MKKVDFILNNKDEFLRFLKSKFILIHNSNIFFRDFHYGTMSFLDEHGMKTKYQEAEKIASEVGNKFEQLKIFKRIDHQTWTLNFPEFVLPRKNKAA